MQRDFQSPAEILRRVAEITDELRRARVELNNLAPRDTATGDVVIRAARLARERTRLERCLYEQRQHAVAAGVSKPSHTRGRT